MRYIRLLAAAPLIAGTLTLATAPATFAITTTIAAQGLITQPVTDEAGVLSGDERGAIENAITNVSLNQQLSVRVVYLQTFGGTQPTTWTEQAVQQNGPNTAVLAIAPTERAYAITGGAQWPESTIDAMDKAAYEQLTQSNWSGAALAALDAADTSGSEATGGALIAGGAGLAAVAGGGYWLVSRRKGKQHQAQQVQAARALDPGDTDSLNRLPTTTLEQVAHDALVTTDESILQAREELKLASAEFGADRVRPFTAAMNSATSALQRAFNIHQRLNDAIPETEPEKRAMLIDIITSCGNAEAAMRAKTEEFNTLRGVLIRGEEEVNKIMARTIDLRARLQPAAEQLAGLKQRYDADMLHSLLDNVDVATASLQEAETALEQARSVAAKPAGQQGALIDILADATHAIDVADTNLGAIEHAETNIANAQTNLPALIQEIEAELREIATLKEAQSKGAAVDVEALDAAAAHGRSALDAIGDRDTTDPLGVYTELSDVDAEIDAAIETAQGVVGDQRRALTMFDQQIQVAETNIQVAEDMIRSRGRIISSQPRTLLAEAKRQHAEALQRRVHQTREAIEYARAATDSARRAAMAAKDDIDDYRRSQRRDTAGSLAQGVLWGMLLSGGNGGGFGGSGGFGGGSGGGGGFSGGGGMTSRGGTF